jgi:hypothetical protein
MGTILKSLGAVYLSKDSIREQQRSAYNDIFAAKTNFSQLSSTALLTKVFFFSASLVCSRVLFLLARTETAFPTESCFLFIITKVEREKKGKKNEHERAKASLSVF